MPRQQIKVPFGYEAPRERTGARGTLWVYDSFDHWSEQQLLPLLRLAEERELAKAVFYPLHDETLRRMEKEPADEPYYARVKNLESLLEEAETELDWTVDEFEGKRKKYTPADTAFRFLEEKYKAPFFLYTTERMANKLAGYDGFEAWLKKIRLYIVREVGAVPHPVLQAHENRWEWVQQ
ncbi:hypothetical protein [Paenibacillus sp. YYML68]|uniref:hypothetical protein n=1 Tax=Paenibacillus sp. YYML68 TaxID=2909250 RepID=UPI002491EED9|nr:hypothetical protein [Paenibacillus sp. YYML68]